MKSARSTGIRRKKKTGLLCGAVGLLLLFGCGGPSEPRAVEVMAELSEESAETVVDKTAGETETETETETEETKDEQPSEKAKRPKVKGIYVTGAMAGTDGMDDLIELVDRTELNAIVIDIKNDEGYVVCEMDAPLANEIGSVKRYVRDMPALIRKCKEKHIYLIARIVSFRDPLLAEAKPEWCLHLTDGSVFRDKSGLAWINPYEKQAWEYLRQIAAGAVRLGFDEVQFDYIRFSTDSGMKNVDFGPGADGVEKTQIIEEFAADMADSLHAMGAAVSADVYGVVIDSLTDQRIVGQDYAALAKYLDYISPMVYPSHYGPYNYHIPVPDAQPYDTVLAAMRASRMTLAGISAPKEDVSGNDGAVSENDAAVSGNDGEVSGNGVLETTAKQDREEPALPEPMEGVRADVRPWLQDFTATWVKGHIAYGPEQIRAQIQAVYDAGYEEWILWNAANRYTEDGLLGPQEEPVGGTTP